MHVSSDLYITYKPVDFQQPPKEAEADQNSALLSLPLEVLEHIGRMFPDVPTAIKYTKLCKRLYSCRPTILTTSLPKLQWVLKKLLTSQCYIASFLEHCKTSPFRNARFVVDSSEPAYLGLIKTVFPNVIVGRVRTIAEMAQAAIDDAILVIRAMAPNPLMLLPEGQLIRLDAEDAERIAALVEMQRHNPALWRLRDLVNQGRLPEIINVDHQQEVEMEIELQQEVQMEFELQPEFQVADDLYPAEA